MVIKIILSCQSCHLACIRLAFYERFNERDFHNKHTHRWTDKEEKATKCQKEKIENEKCPLLQFPVFISCQAMK